MATVKTNTDVFEKAWEGFKGTDWKEKASVSRFVQANYTPYDGDESFLAGPTERSLKIKKIVDETKAGYEAEGRFPMDTRPTSIADIDAGYISKEDELIYGIQNDELFKLNFMPKGGIRMAETALKEHGYEPDPAVHEIFTKYVTTVNDGIFRAYTSNIRRARHAHTVTGLPDAYSRGRIIGVSYNKFIAKLASDFQKPAGLTVVLPEEAQEFLGKLPIEKFHGVGKKSGEVPARYHTG